jgi:hypothetical protein
VLVAHDYNPSYSGGKDQEDHGSMPGWANSLQDPISKNPITKKGWWSGSGVGPEFTKRNQNKQQQQKNYSMTTEFFAINIV